MELTIAGRRGSDVLTGASAGSVAAPVESSAGDVFLLLSPVRAPGACALTAGVARIVVSLAWANNSAFPEKSYVAVTRVCPVGFRSTAGNASDWSLTEIAELPASVPPSVLALPVVDLLVPDFPAVSPREAASRKASWNDGTLAD